jgi:peptidoglycan hydrolase-like protein with peptidoglycan-binding domain
MTHLLFLVARPALTLPTLQLRGHATCWRSDCIVARQVDFSFWKRRFAMKPTSVLTAVAMSYLLTTQAFPAGQTKAQSRQQAPTTNESMRQVQQALKDAGFEPGPVDGILGPRTREALRNFQTANNLQATGEANQDTIAALRVSSEEEGIGATGARDEKKDEKPGATDTRNDDNNLEQPSGVTPDSGSESSSP